MDDWYFHIFTSMTFILSNTPIRQQNRSFLRPYAVQYWPSPSLFLALILCPETTPLNLTLIPHPYHTSSGS
jgi:hypothetical protein